MASGNKLLIRITGDSSEFQNSLNDVQTSTGNLSSNLADIAKTSGLAFVGLAGAIGGSIAAFREQELVENQLNAVIKSTGGVAGVTADEVKRMATELQGVTTFGDEAIISSSNLLLTFKQVGEETFPRAQKAILDVSQAMGVGLKEATIQVGKALNDPVEGLSALRRVGITFTESQKELIKSLNATGRAAEAQSIILDELESQFGGSAEAAAQGTGSFIQLRNVIGDFVENVGKQFVPVLSSVSRALTEIVIRINENEEVFQRLARALAIGAAVTGTVAALATMGVAVTKLTAIIGFLSTTMTGIVGVAISPLGIALAGLGVIIGIAITNFDSIRPSIDRVVETFRGFNISLGGVGGAIQTLGRIGAATFNFLSEVIIGSINSSLKAINGFAEAVQGVLNLDFKQVFSGFKEASEAVGVDIVNTFINAGASAKDGFNQGFSLTEGVTSFNDLLNRSKEFAGSQLNVFQTFAKDRLGIDTTLFSDLGNLFGVFSGDRKRQANDLNNSLIGSQQSLSKDLIAISEDLAGSELDVFNGGTAGLISAAKDRQNKLIDITRQGVKSRNEIESGGQGREIRVGEGGALRELLDNPENFTFGPSGFKRKRGFATAQDIDQISNARNIVTGARPSNPFSNLAVTIGFSSREAQRVLTAQSNQNNRLGTSRSIT